MSLTDAGTINAIDNSSSKITQNTLAIREDIKKLSIIMMIIEILTLEIQIKDITIIVGATT